MRFDLAPDAASGCHGPCKANPATNDWIPAANDMVNHNAQFIIRH